MKGESHNLRKVFPPISLQQHRDRLSVQGGCEEHEKLQDESEMVVGRRRRRGPPAGISFPIWHRKPQAALDRNEKGGRGANSAAGRVISA